MDFNALPSHVWPRHAAREAGGDVSVAGVSLASIAQEYGTPVFVVDEADFRSRCRDMAAAFGGADKVHYASKAFLTRRIARWVEEEGLSLDIASHGELQVALRAGFPSQRITAHGNNKDRAFLQALVDARVGHVVIDSMVELERLEEIAGAAGIQQPVMVRVKPGIEAHTHEFIATSHEDQKFGFSLASGSAYAAAARAISFESLYLIGLHCHVGSQVFDAQGFSLAAQRVLDLYSRIHRELGVDLEQLDLGGGYGIAYTEDETPLDVAAVAQDLLKAVQSAADEIGISAPEILVEPGRAIAGPSTVTVYEVGTVKDVHVTDRQTRRYLAVDGGMSDNIRPALYEAEYDARVINRNITGTPISSRVVGSHCESGDILINNAMLPDDIREGDLLALAATGAYCFAMSSRYNMMGRPAVVSVLDGQASVMVKRENIDDLLQLDVP
ncbi:diaminopimelate decarboxylase [Corynebacterium diphtheriae]|uniref:diaminopimelate decarboxylase n=1 Tax=Corynebacterium diphtheriae TaxID=1717 RepID=UPI0002602601|nr:diaminopimelate decarboxylase [Corynebacterium diphtheriae]EIK56503.1 diaminopimelate decarboxylase [Corynebacterium diphtheriae bv. intermedius str. NCTC 5011]OWM38138.1 diaminopimelate decarboxylase [Corynebacterium diphtheriae bv. intermedius]CAB0643734.1 diaminopimelate decarboxylase [Corynebacterium diphtheriae]